jgi:MFS family permease
MCGHAGKASQAVVAVSVLPYDQRLLDRRRLRLVECHRGLCLNSHSRPNCLVIRVLFAKEFISRGSLPFLALSSEVRLILSHDRVLMIHPANLALRRLAAHSTLHQLASSASGVFWSVFLFSMGMRPSTVLLALAGILALRLVFRPLVLAVVPVVGGRRALVLGTLLSAMQFPLLALIRGPDLVLLLYCAVAAMSGVFYWTCYHAFFATLGDVDRRGRQIAVRQALIAVASVLGPVIGGTIMARLGPWAAFCASATIEAAATLPLLKLDEPRFARIATHDAYRTAQTGVRLFFTDGWIACCSTIAWDLFAFRALQARYDEFGGMLASAALAGALGGMALGFFIDAGHVRRAAWINAAALLVILLLKSFSGQNLPSVTLVAAVAAVLGGLYVPTLMTTVYNEGRASPCPLRFHFVTEAGWDVGGCLASLAAAAANACGAPLQGIILLALPAVALQAHVLNAHARSRKRFSVTS